MTNQDDAVLDPYMGVGSSVIAALMHDRRAYGCDIVPEYVDIARQRVDKLHAGRLRTRPMGKPIYDPSKPNGGHGYRPDQTSDEWRVVSGQQKPLPSSGA